MIFPIGYEPRVSDNVYHWLRIQKVIYNIRWSFHDNNYLLIINNEEDAIAFKLTFGTKSGHTDFVFYDVK